MNIIEGDLHRLRNLAEGMTAEPQDIQAIARILVEILDRLEATSISSLLDENAHMRKILR